MNNLVVRPEIVFDLNISVPELPRIEHNLDDLKTKTDELKEFYDKLIITSDEVDNLLRDKTDINKLLKKIEDNRKDNIKKFKQPITDFEETSKSIEKTLKGIVDIINTKTNVFLDEEKEKKKQQIQIYYAEVYEELEEEYKKYVSPSNIEFNDRWYNKGYDLTKKVKVEEIKDEIRQQYKNIINSALEVENNIEVITNYFNAFKDNHLNLYMYIERYKHTLDLKSIMEDIKNDYESKNEEQKTLKTDEIYDDLDAIFGSDIDDLYDLGTKEVTFKGESDKIDLIIAYANQLGVEEIKNG